MYWEKIDDRSIFAYLPDLEPILGAYSLLQNQKVHNLCTEIYGAEKIAEWHRKYRFLFETYHAIESINILGDLEHLLNFPLQEFSLDGFREYLTAMPEAQFLYRYLDGLGTFEELQQALTDDDALDMIYQKIADDCSSFLGFSSMIRQSKRYIHEFFALAGELKNDALLSMIDSAENKIHFMQDAINSEVMDIGAFECSQLRMGKSFYNRGPYDEFYFIPSLLLPARAVRFFHTSGSPKRQILLLSLRDVERSHDDILSSLKALSDGTRYRILTLLAQGTPLRGLDIAKRLSIAPSTVSHHMEFLKAGGLITEEPVKNAKYYGICRPNIEALLRELAKDFKIKNESK
ncbi:MAG: ArsR/SmtB family transcription factor [Lachnospiraceae bacterium]